MSAFLYPAIMHAVHRVVCPTCHAGDAEQCRDIRNGKPLLNVHDSRIEVLNMTKYEDDEL